MVPETGRGGEGTGQVEEREGGEGRGQVEERKRECKGLAQTKSYKSL